MSNRTAQASRAIAVAWMNEQELVSAGSGTRDWTQEQQQDILERGKAYDEKGRAFEGQHMRSVAEYPEYQGDPKNIQFLTKEEHLAAHDGDWHNPTNWYYDPVTRVKMEFGDGLIIPCEVIELSQPICAQYTKTLEKTEGKIPKESTVAEHSEPRAPPLWDIPHVQSTARTASPQPRLSLGRRFWNGTKKVAKAVVDFVWDNRDEILSVVTPIVVGKIIDKVSESHGVGGHGGDTLKTNQTISAISDLGNPASGNTPDYDLSVIKNHSETHASPQAHTVSAHTQTYHTKEGMVSKKIDSYFRGGKKSNE